MLTQSQIYYQHRTAIAAQIIQFHLNYLKDMLRVTSAHFFDLGATFHGLKKEFFSKTTCPNAKCSTLK